MTLKKIINSKPTTMKDAEKGYEERIKEALKACDDNEKMHDYSISTETIRAILTK
jgi:hypothetical protein